MSYKDGLLKMKRMSKSRGYENNLYQMENSTVFSRQAELGRFTTMSFEQKSEFFDLIDLRFPPLPIYNEMGEPSLKGLCEVLCPELHCLSSVPVLKRTMLKRLKLKGVIVGNDPHYNSYRIFYTRLYEELCGIDELLLFKYAL